MRLKRAILCDPLFPLCQYSALPMCQGNSIVLLYQHNKRSCLSPLHSPLKRHTHTQISGRRLSFQSHSCVHYNAVCVNIKVHLKRTPLTTANENMFVLSQGVTCYFQALPLASLLSVLAHGTSCKIQTSRIKCKATQRNAENPGPGECLWVKELGVVPQS